MWNRVGALVCGHDSGLASGRVRANGISHFTGMLSSDPAKHLQIVRPARIMKRYPFAAERLISTAFINFVYGISERFDR